MVSGADSRRHGHGHHGPAARLPDDERNSNAYCQVRVLNFCFQRMISDDFTCRGRHAGDGRQNTYSFYFHRSERVCHKTFCFLHSMSAKRLKNVKRSYVEHGLTPRRDGNSSRMPATSLSFSDNQRVVSFIINYAETHAILLPGRIPGYKQDDIQLLPASTTKRAVWVLYTASLQSRPSADRSVAYSTFCRLWQLFLPRVVITKPRSDLCWVCQKNTTAIMRAVNQPEEEKSEVSTSFTKQRQCKCKIHVKSTYRK